MTRKFTIEANETLLTVTEWPDGRMFTGDSPRFGALMDMTRVLDEMSDRVVKILRFNTETFAAPEDITEEVAQAWIYETDGNLKEITEAITPAYVRESVALKRWNDDVRATKPVVYSTLNHRQQGLEMVR